MPAREMFYTGIAEDCYSHRGQFIVPAYTNTVPILCICGKLIDGTHIQLTLPARIGTFQLTKMASKKCIVLSVVEMLKNIQLMFSHVTSSLQKMRTLSIDLAPSTLPLEPPL